MVRNLALTGEPTAISFSVSWSQPASGMYDGYAVYIAGQDNVERPTARLDDPDTTQLLIEVGLPPKS